eukprot:CAMPEP_0197073488 /NCGR_PEP_ID=MMETSP1384-20130603/210632_1 /TAXON_ID=29189 /ORGANISM="Ammonia sp." /LENGTH=491 /DNA_ID=CAMNT_0042512325 /DNA_START=84 /DNA_END=1559 /DNA_ORIENTATION=+
MWNTILFAICCSVALLNAADLYPPNQANAANWNPKIEVLSDRGTALLEQLFADFTNIDIQIVSSPTDIWTESPIYVDSLNSIIFSAPGGDGKLYRYDLDAEETSIFIESAGVFGGTYDGAIPFAECKECGPNGMTIGLQGYEDYVIMNQLALARVIAFDPSSVDANNVIVIADNYNGTILNSPNDITLSPDKDALYFTDPIFGLQRDGDSSLVETFARSALGFQGVYRVDYQDVVDGITEPVLITDGMDGPNGLAVTNDNEYLIVSNTAEMSGELVPFWNVYAIQSDYALQTSIDFASYNLSFNATNAVPIPLCDGMEVFNDEILLAACPNGLCVIDLTNLELVGRLTLNQLISNLYIVDDLVYVTSAGNVFTIQLTGSAVFDEPTSTEAAESTATTEDDDQPDSACTIIAYVAFVAAACNFMSAGNVFTIQLTGSAVDIYEPSSTVDFDEPTSTEAAGSTATTEDDDQPDSACTIIAYVAFVAAACNFMA